MFINRAEFRQMIGLYWHSRLQGNSVSYQRKVEFAIWCLVAGRKLAEQLNKARKATAISIYQRELYNEFNI